MKIIQLHFYLLMWSQATEGLLNITVTLGAEDQTASPSTSGPPRVLVTKGSWVFSVLLKKCAEIDFSMFPSNTRACPEQSTTVLYSQCMIKRCLNDHSIEDSSGSDNEDHTASLLSVDVVSSHRESTKHNSNFRS
ncbi:immunoglobulin iota chain [Labeo rohita]|nr:immunoglobulin iota chain [Labeo rohita]